MSINIFERASRLKLRLESPKGLLTVEDLWDLPLTSVTGKANLDDIARGLHAKIEQRPKVSFVNPEEVLGDASTQLAFDVVLRIIEVRVAENTAAATMRARAAQKQQLLELIAQKENEKLAGSSLDELRAMVAQLEG